MLHIRDKFGRLARSQFSEVFSERDISRRLSAYGRTRMNPGHATSVQTQAEKVFTVAVGEE